MTVPTATKGADGHHSGPLAGRIAWMLAAAVIVLTFPVILSGRGGTSEAFDQDRYHLAVIETMADTWPIVDVVHYKSATGPAYHYVLAGVRRYLTDSKRVLQSINMLLSAGLIAAVFLFAARLAGPWPAAAFVLPLLGSKYVISGAIWLTTDNVALLGVVIAVGGALLMPPSARRGVWCGLSAAAAVSIRQIHIWSISPLLALAVLVGPLRTLFPRVFRHDAILGDHCGSNTSRQPGGSWRRAAAFAISAAIPAAVLAAFVMAWGGLMPPQYRDLHSAGMNPSTYGFALALVGAFGVFYLPWTWSTLVERNDATLCIRRQTVVIAGVATAAGVVVALIWPTAFNADAGRWGGPMWEAVRVTPAVADRSLLIVVLSGIGAAVLALMVRAANKAGRGGSAMLLLLTGLGFVLAQSFNSQAWQRYFEPVVLIWLIWLASLATPPGGAGSPRLMGWVAALALATIQFSISFVTVYLPAVRAGESVPG